MTRTSMSWILALPLIFLLSATTAQGQSPELRALRVSLLNLNGTLAGIVAQVNGTQLSLHADDIDAKLQLMQQVCAFFGEKELYATSLLAELEAEEAAQRETREKLVEHSLFLARVLAQETDLSQGEEVDEVLRKMLRILTGIRNAVWERDFFLWAEVSLKSELEAGLPVVRALATRLKSLGLALEQAASESERAELRKQFADLQRASRTELEPLRRRCVFMVSRSLPEAYLKRIEESRREIRELCEQAEVLDWQERLPALADAYRAQQRMKNKR